MKFDKLNNIISISKGKKHTISDAPTPKSIRFIQIDDLRNNDNLKFTDDTKGVLVNEDDLLIVWDGANAGIVGYGKKGLIGSTIAALKKKDPIQYDTVFLGKFLQTKFFYLRSRATGATIPHINRKVLETLKIPVFEKSDQIRIATLLSRADALIAKRKESIRLLDELLKSTFLEMFGDPVKNEKGWKKEIIKSFGEILTGNTPSRKKIEYYNDKFIEWIKTDNIDTNHLYVTYATEYLSEKGLSVGRSLRQGALLVTCIAGSLKSIGNAALTNRPIAFNQQINAIQPNEDISPIFLYWLFKICKKYIQNHATKGMKKIIIKSIFEKILMIKPPLPLQTQFAQIAERTESLKAKCQVGLLELENLYGSLSQRAFRGELDLSGIPVELSGKSEIDTKQKTTHPELEVKPKPKKKDIDKEQKQLAKALKQIIKDKFRTSFTFDKLWDAFTEQYPIDTDAFEFESEAQNMEFRQYETIKSIVFEWLDAKKPFLFQVFDEKRKEMVLKPAI